jgi:hypothetical protein
MCFSLLHNEPFEIYPSTPEYTKLFDLQKGETLRSDTLIVRPHFRHPATFSGRFGHNNNPKKDQHESNIFWPFCMVVPMRTLR